jgi:transposase
VCCYRPDGSDARLACHLREGAYDTAQLSPIVATLGRLVDSEAPVILIWDNLPAYAPDLDPVEGLWANLKGVELANRACRSLEELAAAAE